MKKRLLGLLTAAAMLLSAMPVFADGKIPSGDDLIWYNNGTNASEFENGSGVMSVDGGAIKISLTDTEQTTIWQSARTGLKTAQNSDITAILSFKIKAGQTDKYFWLTIGDESVKNSQLTTMAMTSDGKISASPESKWISDKSLLGSQVYAKDYTANTWYDITMAFKADNKIDYYLDGAKWFTATTPEAFNLNSENMGFRPGVKYTDKFAEPGTADFWIDDIMWIAPSDESFYAFSDSETYTVENPVINLKFTEQVSNTALASDIKVYNVQSGAAVAATAAFDGNRNLKVNISEKLAAAEEYRIAMPALTSVTGKAIYNDNVYFMSGESVETIFSDDFSGYDKSVKNGNSAGEFYKPANWYTNTNWATQYTTLQPLSTTQSDGINGNVVEFKKQNSSAEAGDWGWAAIYREFGKKINSGVLTVEYDVKAVSAPKTEEVGTAHSQLLFGVYKTALTEEQYTYPNSTDSAVLAKNIIGREASIKAGATNEDNVNNNMQFIGGIQGGAICNFKNNTAKDVNGFYTVGGSDRYWSIDDTQAWYNVKVTFDYNNKTVSTKVNGNSLGATYPMSNFNIQDGISALSFGSSNAGSAFKKDIYLDNVTVKHDTSTTKVSKIRFIDGNGAESGISDSVSTLSEKVQITFVNGAIDSDCATGGITLTDSENNSIGLINGEFNSDRTVYTAELADLMKANTNYTLSVSGLTSGGLGIPVKTYSLKTEENGYFDVSKPYINGTIAAGNTITIGIKVLNTTGENKNVTFSYATYSGNQMIGCELEEKGVGGENKAVYTKEYTLTLDAETAAKLTDIRAFVWGDLTSVVPLTDFASLTK